MSEIQNKLEEALKKLREENKKRNFTQSVELVVNLKNFNVKKEGINTFVNLHNKIKDKKIAGFFETKSNKIDTITPDEFDKYKDKKELKKLSKKYDFFLAQANLMPKVASTFGKVLGPAGKMPSPQMGILTNPDDKSVEDLKNKLNHSVRIRTKEASVKLIVGKEDYEDSKLVENMMTIYNTLTNSLTRGKDNIKNIEIKFTMSKPQKISIK